MNCPKCGALLENDARFCTECGTALNESVEFEAKNDGKETNQAQLACITMENAPSKATAEKFFRQNA